MFTITTNSPEQTSLLGEKIANLIQDNLIICLEGDLGAGKTTFTQSVALALGVKEKVNSPTFNILKCYFSGSLPLYHIDAYRLEDHINMDIGLEEVIEGDGVCLIEWAKFIPEYVFEPLKIEIEIMSSNSRKFKISSDEKKYNEIFTSLESLKGEMK